jgi:hypothetical protein
MRLHAPCLIGAVTVWRSRSRQGRYRLMPYAGPLLMLSKPQPLTPVHSVIIGNRTPMRRMANSGQLIAHAAGE